MGNNDGARRNKQAVASNPAVQAFIEGLTRLEKEGDIGGLLDVFAESCSVANVVLDKPLRGQQGARLFWQEYRDTFGDIESQFNRIIETEDQACLEWTSRGTLKTGRPIEYSGVSLLALDGDKVSDFRAYFDSRHLTAHL